MDSESVQTQVRTGMRVRSFGGHHIGKVWNVVTRETEAYVVVRPVSFWQGIIDGFAPRYADPERGLLYLPQRCIKQVQGKQVIVMLRRDEAMACTDRPPWLHHEKEIMPVDVLTYSPTPPEPSHAVPGGMLARVVYADETS